MDIKKEYERWLANATADADVVAELKTLDDAKIEDAFYRDLAFGTGGLRGVIGAGTNRMNIYTVAKASQGLADYLKKNFETPSVAIGYDSRIKSDVFAKVAAGVFAANGVKVNIWPVLMPVPTVSFATRYLHTSAGVMVTASHNPSKYNGYKVYGADGCQITTEAAAEILAEIEKLDIFADVKTGDFEAGVADGSIQYIPDEVYTAFVEQVKNQSVLFGEEVNKNVAIVYSPLNGTGLKPVTRTLKEMGYTNITVVKEQEQPDGKFPTCPYPNPEIKEAMALGMEYAEKCNADLLLATDPDCDRVGIAVKNKAGEYELLTGNKAGEYELLTGNQTGITILHSNDLHGDFLAEQVDEKLVGGVSMLSGYIEKVRAEEPNTIYAIAGDMFRGSVIDSEYKGLSTIEIMNALAPDIVTIGNHEVDYGIAHLLFIEKCARFPIINANLYIKNTPTRLFTPYKILRVDGMNILFIGIITQDVINQTKSESLVGSFVDTAAAAAEVGKICNAHNSIDIDFTVLLTHIGFEEDKHLARQLDPAWGVDLIIGGHSHTLPEHAVEKNGVVIAQAGTGTDQIGRFDIIVDTDNNCIDSYTWHTVPITAETCPRNPAMEQVLHRFTSQVDEKYSHIVARFRRELTHPERTRETELGNLFADIFTRSLGIDIMLIGSGSIRAEKLGPIVTYGDLIEGFPYDDGVFMFKVTGQQLRQMLHYMLREEAYTGHTEFYQLPSTLRLRYDRAKGDFDYFTYCGKEVGKEISDDALFTVGLQNYHFKNIESFFNISYDTICKLQKPRSVATSCVRIS